MTAPDNGDRPVGSAQPWVGPATFDARDAAEHAGVTVRELAPGQMAHAAAVLEAIWGTRPIEAPLMVALAHAGSSVAGAFSSDELVGVSIGYFATPLGQVLHSHVTGVSATHAGRGVGRALKLHQRAWCLARGLTRMTWTFDPLVSRNAAFNIAILGVDISEYLVDFYGEMTDGVNAGQGSDRLLASWPLDRAITVSPASAATAPSPGADASALLTTTAEGHPRPHLPDPTARWVCVAVPSDITTLRHTDPALAARWRGAVRGGLAPLIDGAWRVAGFDDHRYFLEST